MKHKFLIIITGFIFISAISGCGDRPIFDELAENRIKVIVKGTYESNNPRPWQYVFSEDDSVYRHAESDGAEDPDPDTFLIDIAGIRVSGGDQDQYFANYRKTGAPPLTDTDPFFNGTGILMKNDDVSPGITWQYALVYLRKMVFNNAAEYLQNNEGSWAYDSDVEVIFDEETTYGLNFNLFQTLTYYDSLRSNYEDINRIFPLVAEIEDGFRFDNTEESVVLEVRMVIKNFVKKYEYLDYDEDDEIYRLRHFYALSDWLRDVLKNEADGKIIGGNLLSCARYYIPGKTVTITAGASSSARSAGNRYVIAVKNSHDISEYQPPARTRPVCDIPDLPDKPVDKSDINVYIENILDYSLHYTLYKENYDIFIDCVDDGTYATEWDAYESGIDAYKIPQIVTWSDDTGAYTFENVPAGFTYRIYQSENDPGANSMPVFDTVELAGVTVTEDMAGSTISLPQVIE